MIARLQAALDERNNAHRLRCLGSNSGIDFCSNDYLGLSRAIPSENSLAEQGSTGSRLISGNDSRIEALEQHLATFHGHENTLIFGSGYSANSGLLACLGQRGDIMILDDRVHASLIDGARLSFAKRRRFSHNDPENLSRQLSSFKRAGSANGRQAIVVVEAVYSMDGDIAPLAEMADICAHYQAALIVDEAHSIGLFDDSGQGLVAQLKLQSQVFAVVLTFGKAMGFHGAAIAGSDRLRNYLINFCRPFIYTTAPAPHTIAQLEAAHQRMQAADDARGSLKLIIDYFNRQKDKYNWSDALWQASQTPIQSLIIGDDRRAKRLEYHLRQAGLAVKAILSPTVAEGSERLRVCLHSFNSQDEVDALMMGLADSLAA